MDMPKPHDIRAERTILLGEKEFIAKVTHASAWQIEDELGPLGRVIQESVAFDVWSYRTIVCILDHCIRAGSGKAAPSRDVIGAAILEGGGISAYKSDAHRLLLYIASGSADIDLPEEDTPGEANGVAEETIPAVTPGEKPLAMQ